MGSGKRLRFSVGPLLISLGVGLRACCLKIGSLDPPGYGHVHIKGSSIPDTVFLTVAFVLLAVVELGDD